MSFRTRVVLALAIPMLGCAETDPLDGIRRLQEAGRFAASVDRLRELVDENPAWPEAQLMLGTALLRTGEAGLAVWPLLKAEEFPDYAVPAGLLLAEAMLESRTAPDAAKAIDRVLAIEPENVAALALRIRAYLELGRIEEALLDMDRVAELDPDNLVILVPRVTALITLGRIEEAETALESARERLESAEQEIAPSMRARLCIARGLFAFEKGEQEAAEAQYAECVWEFPTDQLVVIESVGFYDRIGRSERATEILQAAFEETRGSIFRTAMARRMGALGQPEEELRLLREQAEERSTPMAWFMLADYHVTREEFEPALEAFERALAASPSPSSRLRFAYADTLVQAGQYEKARQVAQNLEQPELRSLIRGRILLGEDRPRAALEAFEAGIRLWPNNPAGRFLAGSAAERLGDFGRAASEYREALRAAPADTEAGLALAQLHATQEEYDAALNAAGRYVRSHPQDPNGYLESIRIAHRAGEHQVAATGLERLGQLPGQAAVAVAEEARLLGSDKGPELGIEVVERAPLDLTDPANEAALRVLLEQLGELGRHSRAEELVRAALEAHPDAAVFHELHGLALRGAGAPPARARAAFERAVELDPERSKALAGLAELSAEAGDRAAAIALYDRAAAADATDPAPQLAAAALVLAAQDVEGAADRLAKALARHPREARAAHELALIYVDKGDLERAAALARRAAWLRLPEAELTLGRIRDLQAERGDAAAATASES